MDAVYRALVDIVGSDYVSVQPEDLFTYSKDLGTSEPGKPDYVAAPKTTGAVSRILKLANEHKTPVIPLGGGMSLAGLALPLKGGIILDLKRMDRILELNEKGRYVVVEAGASHGKLTSYLHKHAPRLMHSEPGAPPAATIGGNLAIHGQGDLAHPYGFNSDMIAGMEVVLPTGEICRIGSCAMGEKWYTLHPLPDLSLFLGWNGSTGIITKVSLKLYPCKKIREMDIFCVEDENLVPEILYELTHAGMAGDLVAMSSKLPPYSDRLHMISIALSGDSRQEMEFKRQILFDTHLAKYIREGTGGISMAGRDVERPMVSKASDWKKGGGFEYVGAILPVTDYPECYRRGAAISAAHDIPYTVLGRVIGAGHAMMFSWSYAFNRADEQSIAQARKALHETDDLVMELGGTIWKPAVYGQKLLLEKMDANTLQMMKKVKTMLDPNAIMNPGHWEVD